MGAVTFGRALAATLEGGRQSPAKLSGPQSVDWPDALAGLTFPPDTPATKGAGTWPAEPALLPGFVPGTFRLMTGFLPSTVGEAVGGGAAESPASADCTAAALDTGVEVGGMATAATGLPAPMPEGELSKARGSIQPMTTLTKPTAKKLASPPSAISFGRRDGDVADGVFALTMVWATFSVCEMGAAFTAFGSGGGEAAWTGSADKGGPVSF